MACLVPRSSGWLSSEVVAKLDTTSKTVNKYAKAAGIATPGRGKRNHRYSDGDLLGICRQVRSDSSDAMLVSRCKELLEEMETKSKDRN